jgi:hypothetical protein
MIILFSQGGITDVEALPENQELIAAESRR